MSDTYASTATIDEIGTQVGREIGVSRWFEITQPRVDAFADCTEDWYFIHTDPVRAARETPWGGTIGHGFLTASLLSAMAYDVLPAVAGSTVGVNYGFDRLRFVSPVPVGGRVRGRFTLAEADRSRPGELTRRLAVVIEIEGQDRPALAAEWLIRDFFDDAGEGATDG